MKKNYGGTLPYSVSTKFEICVLYLSTSWCGRATVQGLSGSMCCAGLYKNDKGLGVSGAFS